MGSGYMPSYKGWINKAKSDLHLAEKGVKEDDLTLDTAIFHTQQCAEKALKGFLAFHEKPLNKTHDLLKLLEMCCYIEVGFSALQADAAVLSPFATEFRYPVDEEIILERAVVLDAIDRARKMLNFVENLISN
jgi:HEPN domain-containing protein